MHSKDSEFFEGSNEELVKLKEEFKKLLLKELEKRDKEYQKREQERDKEYQRREQERERAHQEELEEKSMELARVVQEKDEKLLRALQEREKVMASESIRSQHDIPITFESLAEFMRSKYPILPFQVRNDSNCEIVQRLCYSFGEVFKFQDGGRNFPGVRELLKDLLSKIRSKKLDKQDFTIPVFHSAPGTGKSRTLDELVVSIRKWLTEADIVKNFQGHRVNFIPHTVSFGNGTAHSPVFAAEKKEREAEFGSRPSVTPHIVMRTLHSHIGDRVSLRVLTDDFVQRFGEKNFFNLTLSLAFDCMELLYKDSRQRSENDEHQDTVDYFVHVIMIDEYNKSLFNNVETKVFVLDVLRAIGGEIIECSFLHSPRALWGIMAGTEFIPIDFAATNSSIEVKRMKFSPLLSEPEMAAILDHFVQNHKKPIPDQLNDWRVWNHFRAILRKIAGYPRVLEKFIQHLINFWNNHTQSDLTSTDLYNILINQITINSHVSSEDAKKAFKATIFGGELRIEEEERLEDNAVLVINWIPVKSKLVKTISVPLVLMEKVLNSAISKIAHAKEIISLFKLASEDISNAGMDGLVWEKFCQRHLAFRFALCASIHEGDVKLGILFHNALMNTNTRLRMCSLDSPKLFGLENSRQELKSKTEERAPTGLERVVDGSIWLNGSGANAGDILIRLGNVMIQVQCRFADKDGSSQSYDSLVHEEHLQKNKALVDAWNIINPEDPLQCVSVFMVGAPVKGIPEKLEQIRDDIIIIHTENLERFLGPFAHFHSLVAAHGFLRVNELSEKGLGRALATIFSQEQPLLAEAIVEIRAEKGSFKDINDLVERLDTYKDQNGQNLQYIKHNKSTLEKSVNKIIF